MWSVQSFFELGFRRWCELSACYVPFFLAGSNTGLLSHDPYIRISHCFLSSHASATHCFRTVDLLLPPHTTHHTHLPSLHFVLICVHCMNTRYDSIPRRSHRIIYPPRRSLCSYPSLVTFVSSRHVLYTASATRLAHFIDNVHPTLLYPRSAIPLSYTSFLCWSTNTLHSLTSTFSGY